MLKNKKGITLVALVVTVVVLLILAGVALNLTLGENGLITKAKDAKNVYDNAVVKDQGVLDGLLAEIDDLVGRMPEIDEVLSDGEYITDTVESDGEYYEYEGKYYKLIWDDTDGYEGIEKVTDSNKIAWLKEMQFINYLFDDGELISESESEENWYYIFEYNDKKYKVTENKATGAYSVRETDTKADNINLHIGDIINYTAPQASGYSGNWQILYATDNEVFIITEDITEYGNTLTLSKTLNNSTTYNYVGSQDLKTNYANHRNGNGSGYNYGSTWNSVWLKDLDDNSSTANTEDAQTIAYLCDPDNWQKYVTGKASYAVGGPTCELIVAALKQTMGEDVFVPSYYGNNGKFYHEYITHQSPNGWYFTLYGESVSPIVPSSGKYAVPSPSNFSEIANDRTQIFGIDDEGYNSVLYSDIGAMQPQYGPELSGLRPLVSIPISEIEITNDEVSIKN